MHRVPHRPQAGFVAVAVLFIVLMVMGLSLGMLQHGLAERGDVRRGEGMTEAFELAELGLARAEMELKSEIDFDGNGLGNADVTMPGNDGSYLVTATQEPGSDSLWRVVAVGNSGLSVRRLEAGLRVTRQYRFHHAAAASVHLELKTSATTDAYDSALGSWASQATNSDSAGAYANAAGHVASNDDIDLWDDARVRGDASAGDDVEIHGATATVTGTTIELSTALTLLDPSLSDFEAAHLTNANGGIVAGSGISYDPIARSLTLSGTAVLTLEEGTYFFDDLTISDQASLVCSGPCRIYLAGDLLVTTSGSVNYPGEPTNLRLVCHAYALTPGYTAPTGALTLSGSTLFASLTIYGPSRDVTIAGSTHLYGGVVGRNVLVDGTAQLHYDQALATAVLGPAETERLYWREPSPPVR